MKPLVFIVSLLCLLSSSFATDGSCYVRFLHGCTQLTGPLDLSVNGALVINAQPLASVSAYVAVDAGVLTLSVSADVKVDVDLKAGKHYTIAVVGDLSASIQVFIDDVAVNVNAPLVRVVVLAPLNIDLNVYVNAQLLGLLSAHAEVTASIPYHVAVEGSVTVAVKNLLGIALGTKVFAAVKAKAYTVFLIPSLLHVSIFDIIVVEDITVQIAATANVRLLHGLVKILPGLDLVINGNVVVSGSTYGLASVFAQVNVGQVTIQVRLAGTATVLVELPGVTLHAGNYYTVCIFGENTLNLKIVLDSVLAVPSGVVVRVGHLAETLGSLIVSLLNQPLIHLLPNPINCKDITNALDLYAPATINLGSVSLNVVLLSADVQINLGQSCIKVVIGSSTSTSRPLAVVSLCLPALHINLDLDLAQKSLLNIDLKLLKVNNALLGGSL
jgi:hypothetical protein